MKHINDSHLSNRTNREQRKKQKKSYDQRRKKIMRRYIAQPQQFTCLQTNQNLSTQKTLENIQYKKIKARQLAKRERMSTHCTRNKFY